MKAFCHTHAGFYETEEGCLYCKPPIPPVAVQSKRPNRAAWSVYDLFPIEEDYQCSGITWTDLENIYKDTVLKGSVTVFSNIPVGNIALNCILGYDVAQVLMKYPPPKASWLGANSSLTPTFLGVWKPVPNFREVFVYGDLHIPKQLIPSDCVFMTSFPVDSTYLQNPNFDHLKLFDPLEVTVTARG